MQQQPLTERRHAPRVPVHVRTHQLVDGQTHPCFTTNLSATGLYMERPTEAFSRRTQQLQLEIPLPDQAEPVWAAAEVVYDRFDALRHGTAVRFTAICERDRRRLQAWVRRCGTARRGLREAV